jgi:glutathionylspermidine synthase
MARIDFFMNEETGEIMLCEINTDGTSAMNEDRIFGELLRHNSAFQTYMRDKPYQTFELFDRWVTEFQATYKAFSRSETVPQMAITDFLDKGTVNEFIRFREAFARQGIKAEICDIRELTYENAALKTPSGMTVDAIYRRAVTVDIIENYANVTPFIQAVKDRAVCLVGGFCTQIVHNKRIFCILQHPATQSFLTEGEAAFVKKHLPATFLLSEDTAAAVLPDRERWIIKPCDSYGSKGVYAGVDHSEEDWARLVRENMGNDYLAQQFIQPYKTVNVDLTENDLSVGEYSNITGVFCYNEKPYGIYSRLAPGEIISTVYNERAVATILI